MKAEREDHRHKKRLEWLASNSYNPIPDKKYLAVQWEEAEACVENVAQGICITLKLQQLIDLKVQLRSGSLIRIDAKRMRGPDDSVFNTSNSRFLAEFCIDGLAEKLQQQHLSYEYESDVGLLFIYVDDVCLSDSIPSSTKLSTVVSQVKDAFKRLFVG